MRSSHTCPTTHSETDTHFEPPGTQDPHRDRLGWSEWTVGLMLLFASLPGPWLTVVFPAAVAFALHDRRTIARIAATVVAGVIAVLMAVTEIGGVLLTAAALAMAGTAWAALRGPRRLGLGEAALPALLGAAVGLAIGAVLAPTAVGSWEAALERGLAVGGEQAIERYRLLGMDEATLRTLEGVTAEAAGWLVRLWPALVALTLWLGAWLAYRLLGRWGRVTAPLGRRLRRRPFVRFRLSEPVVWALIAGLAAMWVPLEMVRRVAANVLVIAAILCALQGLAVGAWWLNRRGMGVGARFLLVVVMLVFLPPVVLVGAVLLGLAEHWLALRERPHGGRSAN